MSASDDKCTTLTADQNRTSPSNRQANGYNNIQARKGSRPAAAGRGAVKSESGLFFGVKTWIL